MIENNIRVIVDRIRGIRIQPVIEALEEVPVRRNELCSAEPPSKPPVERPIDEPARGPLLPSPTEVREIAERQIGRLGGTLSDCHLDDRRLFLRAILNHRDETQPRDRIQGGVAVAVLDDDVLVRPYTFCQVCRNGAMMIQVGTSGAIPRVGFASPTPEITAVGDAIKDAITACATPEAFGRSIDQMRSATWFKGTLTQFMLTHMADIPRRKAGVLRREIQRRFLQRNEGTLYDLMNAVTAVARDEKDPEIRWRLEELGGGVLAPCQSPRQSAGTNVKVVELVG